jgi:hypothetical protein
MSSPSSRAVRHTLTLVQGDVDASLVQRANRSFDPVTTYPGGDVLEGHLACEHQLTVRAPRVPEHGPLDEAEKGLVTPCELRLDEPGALLRSVRFHEMAPEISHEPEGHGEIVQHKTLRAAVRSGA